MLFLCSGDFLKLDKENVQKNKDVRLEHIEVNLL